MPLYAIFSYCFYASWSSWQMPQYPQNIWDWISHLSIDALALFSAQKFVEHWHWTVRWGKTCKLRTSPSRVQCPIFVSWQGNLSFNSFQEKILTKLGTALGKICIIHCYYTPNVRFRVHVHCSDGLWKTALSLLFVPTSLSTATEIPSSMQGVQFTWGRLATQLVWSSRIFPPVCPLLLICRVFHVERYS